MKLEHLAPYLPYGLKCRTKIGDLFLNRLTNCETFKAWFVYTYDSKNNLVKHNYEANTSNDNTCGKGFRLNEIKPILRPLTDLTKEIEHNGEKFVPIMYCANTLLNDKNDMFFKDIIFGDRCVKMYVKCGILGFNTIVKYDNDIKSIKHGNDTTYEIQQKLLEWHFDVFGLIEKGEAIDINTL